MGIMCREVPSTVREIGEKLKPYFVFHPNFPKPGITFWDVFALFRNLDALLLLDNLLAEYAINLKKHDVDVVVGLESRGFLLGPLLAKYLNCIFVPIRKKGKLPGLTYSQAYSLEYGEEIVEIQAGSIKEGANVVIIDDCVATGGTLIASQELIKNCKANVLEFIVLYLIPDVEHREDCPDVTILVN